MNKKLYPYYENQQYKMHQDNMKIQSISRMFFKDSIPPNIMKSYIYFHFAYLSLHINWIIKIIRILYKKKIWKFFTSLSQYYTWHEIQKFYVIQNLYINLIGDLKNFYRNFLAYSFKLDSIWLFMMKYQFWIELLCWISRKMITKFNYNIWFMNNISNLLIKIYQI